MNRKDVKIILTLILTAILLSSCGGKANYRNDLTVKRLLIKSRPLAVSDDG